MRTPRAPIPPGWPGDDPTQPEDLAVLGHRRRRHRRAQAHGLPAPAAPVDPRAGPDESAGPDVRRADARRSPAATRAPDEAEEQALDDRRHDHDGLDDRDHVVAGNQPAGRVLVVMVVALLLAMLVNADALVARAERRPAGRDRDRALAVWHPVQDVSHALQLHRIRQLADRIVGDDADDDAPVAGTDDARRRPADDGARENPTPTTPAGADPDGAAPAVELRTPTTDEPLRLWVGGDSMAQVFGPALATAAEATGVVSADVHYEMASGLTRPDYFDWPDALRAAVAADDPEVLVVVFGVNDGQGIVLPDGTPVPDVADPRWTGEYRRRVAALMDQLRADDRLVLWVLLPPMRDADYGARMAVVREAVAAEAASRPWVATVDAAASVAGPAGAYADAVPDAAGTPTEVRRGDGIHLSTAGADRLAAQVLEALGARVDLTGTAG